MGYGQRRYLTGHSFQKMNDKWPWGRNISTSNTIIMSLSIEIPTVFIDKTEKYFSLNLLFCIVEDK